MKKDFETKVIGWAFITAAILLWGGWFFSPHHLGEYIVASDFEAVNQNLWTWIWLYRMHIFGWVIMGPNLSWYGNGNSRYFHLGNRRCFLLYVRRLGHWENGR